MAYQSKYKGKQIDEAVSQAIDKLPVRMTEAEDSIAALEKHKADVGSVPTKVSQLTDDVGLVEQDDCDIAHGIRYNEGRVEVVKATDAQIDAKTNNYRPIVPANLDYAVKSVGDGYYATEEQLRELELSGGGSGNGAVVISVHDELYKEIIPEDGQMYIVKYHDMPAWAQENDANGKKVPVTTDTIRYRFRIGDGATPLCDLPNVSNIQAGEGNGSIIQIDPTYDGGDDREGAPNEATGQLAAAFGKYNKVLGKNSFAAGYNNTIEADRAFAAGDSNYIAEDAKSAFIAGVYNILLTKSQSAVGMYNDPNDLDALFMIGNGSNNEKRSNAFVVKKDGSVKIGQETLSDSDITTMKILNEKSEDVVNASNIGNELINVLDTIQIPSVLSSDIYGKITLTPKEGTITNQDYKMVGKKYGGCSDVTDTQLSAYTEYPAEGSGSERKWAWLGTVASRSYSNGTCAGISTRTIITTSKPDEWAAFKIKVDEDGEYTLIGDMVHYIAGGRIEAYLLPMSEALEEELAPDNEETYGELVSAGDTRYPDRVKRVNHKLFSELTSVAGAEPIGKAVNTYDTVTEAESTPFNDKFGAVNLSAGEYVLLLRVLSGTEYNMMFRSFHLKKFVPLTDAIKVGDTVLTESDIKLFVKHSDFSSAKGIVMVSSVSSAGTTYTPTINMATTTDIRGLGNKYKPIVPANLETAVEFVNAKHAMATKTYVDNAVSDAKEELNTQMGDVSEALDAIIAMQTEVIGGGV